MPRIRKVQAGSDSFGNVWKKDGDVVEVPHEQAEALLLIEDGQFWLADDEKSDADETNEHDDDPESGNAAGAGKTRTGDDAEPTPVNPVFSEVHPAAPTGEPTAVDVPQAASEPEADDPRVATEDPQADADKQPAPKPAAKKTAAARKSAATKPQE